MNEIDQNRRTLLMPYEFLVHATVQSRVALAGVAPAFAGTAASGSVTWSDSRPLRSGPKSRFACVTAYTKIIFTAWFVASLLAAVPRPANCQILDKQKQLKSQTFWDNRDWDWYVEQIPFFECPDADITTTYYYRWDLLTKHLTYGSPNTGYLFTEFIDRPFWSGAYGAISCPAGHQLYEARWLRSPRIANDYSRYWFRTPGAQPRNYSTWLADSVWAVNRVHPNEALVVDLLPDLIRNYEGWEQRQFVPEIGLFWQTGHDDGMEFNINSRQTVDIVRGAPSYRPSFNAYMWADAMAIAKIARLAGQAETAKRFVEKAESLKAKMIERLWDERRQFFFPVFKNDEQRDGHKIKALSKTYETGQFAGDPHGRELIGYVPWQFNIPDPEQGYEIAWAKLMDRDGFYADFGPSTVERNDPMFLLMKSCCWWSGQSWPYATTQTLKALANVVRRDETVVTKADYLKLLTIYAKSHRKDGKPYLAEALHPDTGSFEGHDNYNHSEHYFHSGFCDLVITGLVGLTPRDDQTLEIKPLAPADWDYFALDDVSYRGHRVSIVWDKTGERYKLGPGLHILVNGNQVASSPTLSPMSVELGDQPEAARIPDKDPSLTAVNFAVNNDGTYYPRLTATYTSPGTSISKLNDGNYWYLPHPPNRWTCEGSPNDRDSIVLDFGTVRQIHTVKLFVLADDDLRDSRVRAPQQIELEAWIDDAWRPIGANESALLEPVGHRPAVVRIEPVQTNQLRVTLQHATDGKSGLTEFEAWGDASLPVDPVPPPPGNLAYNPGNQEFPHASASHSDRFGGLPEKAIDGKTVYLPTPMNRWTSYESQSPTDWLQIDFGKPVEFRRVELAIYDDRGGVQPPADYVIQYLRDGTWQNVSNPRKTPAKPVGGATNTVRFDPVTSAGLRVVFTHKRDSRSGVTEMEVWND